MTQKIKITQYKLFNTDGKTFFDFRRNPKSRCEGFTVTYCDDGTVVMSGDYGTLCWKRNYHHADDKEFRRDYGFPGKETGIRYFEEKVCQHGVRQKVEEWTKEKAEQDIKDYIKDYGDDEVSKKLKEYLEDEFRFIEDFEEVKFYQDIQDINCDLMENPFGEGYTPHFKFMYQILGEVSDQILEAVSNVKGGKKQDDTKD